MKPVYSLRDITDLECGDHFCFLYETDEEHQALLTPFLRQGLERDEKVLYILDAHTAEAILGYLRDDGLEVESYLTSGQLRILTPDETYLQGGIFDPYRMIALLQTEMEHALAEGYRALRTAGEMSWVLRGLPGSERLIELESKLNMFYPGSKCLGICQYDRRRSDSAVLLDVLVTHPNVIVGTEIYDNFYYIPQTDLGQDHTVLTLRNWLENLSARKQVEKALRKAHDELEERVQERTAELVKANEVLQIEILERKRVEDTLRENLAQLSKKNRYEKIISAVTRSVHQSINLEDVLENAVDAMSKNIDRADLIGIYFVEGKEAVIKAYRSLSDRYMERAGRILYPKGFTWKTITEGKPSYVADVDKDPVIGPAGREEGIKSYLSIPIRFDGRIVGCVNINSFEKNAFDEEELKLLEIVAQQIEAAINNAKQVEAIRESKELYRALYEDSPSMYFTVDSQGKILSVNRFGAEQLGYTPEELIGQSVVNIFYEDDKKAVLEHLSKCLQNLGQIVHREFRKIRKEGSVLWVRESARAVRSADGNAVVLIVCEDITELKRAEEQIKASLEEKEVLLKEIHHRVKNNLQVISSLLDLQSEYIKNKKALEVFNETQSRIKSIALIHEQLYQSKDLVRIDFAEYTQNLGSYLFQSYGVSSNDIKLRVKVDNILMGVDTAIICGLIINELVSNSLKYAFPKGWARSRGSKSKGEICIGLNPYENKLTLIVSDNGIGFPKDVDFRKTKSLGLQLVVALTDQLGGTIKLSRGIGTTFKITFSQLSKEI
jgi:PAS domain S-box-containing protein